MMRMRHPALIAGVLAAFVALICGCGYLLHPERRHAVPSRQLDTQVVVMDCLWFFAGIAPGVVALAVDFATGAAYYPEGDSRLVPGTRVQVHVHGKAPASCHVSLRCVGGDGRDLTPPARVRARRGEALPGPLSIAVPPEIGSAAAVVLLVDGAEQARWAVGETLN